MPKKADQYDEGGYNYQQYWSGRDYEHAAEEIAIKRLLRGKKFKNAADIGGGYGRLCKLLKNYAKHVTLVEPSKVQLKLAKVFLRDAPDVDQKTMQADNLKFKTGSLDLVTMVRVMHHLPEPKKELTEVHRVLGKDGFFVLEMANYTHFRNRLKYLLRGRALPSNPVDIRSAENKRDDEVAFVNHNPKTIIKMLDKIGFRVEKVLSVSNLRSPALKKVMPRPVMLTLEKVMQPALSKTYFGPSIFFLLKKK